MSAKFQFGLWPLMVTTTTLGCVVGLFGPSIYRAAPEIAAGLAVFLVFALPVGCVFFCYSDMVAFFFGKPFSKRGFRPDVIEIPDANCDTSNPDLGPYRGRRAKRSAPFYHTRWIGLGGYR